MRILPAIMLAVFLPSATLAADAPTRVRGTIQVRSDTMLTIATREGPSVEVALSPGYAIRGVSQASASDIKVGDYVGVASVPKSAGGDGAVEVLIFPASMKGTGEGSYPWDLQPNSTMTNATVSNAVQNVDGQRLTLSYPQGSKTVDLSPNIPVVTFTEASQEDLAGGATVFVPATKGADGKLSTKFVVVGKNGVVPPM
ncbi:hypothetical protein [Aureimonas psammosilenae]|jgi:hypothetical protein|uniref:hypothetical protein n=1 Tax=Aureimonas psammosilenae TaxID=2495496 RepID=UPI0012612477|nr:hypothetical protein [Aureimonas psammosilenae]